MNSINPDSTKILSVVYWIAANVSGGCQIHADRVMGSELCKQVFQLIKFKKDRKLVKEMITFIYNGTTLGGVESVTRLIKLKIIWLICEILTNFIAEDIIVNTLKLLIKLLEKTDNKCFIIEELSEYNTISKLENIALGTSVSGTLAEIILKDIKSDCMDDF